MRFRNRARKEQDDDRLLPLINVVFLLLIFFMIAGRLAASDPFAIVPPESLSEGQSGGGAVTVLVSAEGRVAVDGATVDKADFAALLAARLDDENRQDVRLKADGGADATFVVEIMELMREAGAERVRLLTVPERR